MRDTVYLVFSKRGIDRMLNREPKELRAGEHAVKVTLEAPDTLWRPNPVPVVNLSIPEAARIEPRVSIPDGSPILAGEPERAPGDDLGVPR